LQEAGRAAGLIDIQPQAGETKEQAVDRKVMAYLQSILDGQQNVLSLGPLSYALRSVYGGEVLERAFPVVVQRVEAARPAVPPLPQQQPGTPQPEPDSPTPQP